MRILLLVYIYITLLYQVWGKKKHFLIETKDDHEKPIVRKDVIVKNNDDYSYEVVNRIDADQEGNWSVGLVSNNNQLWSHFSVDILFLGTYDTKKQSKVFEHQHNHQQRQVGPTPTRVRNFGSIKKC